MSFYSILWGVFMEKNILDIVDCEFLVDGLQISMICGTAPNLPNNSLGEHQNNFHTHFWYELFYVNRDHIVFHLPDRSITVKEGQFLLVNPNHAHYVDNPSRVPVFSFSVKPVSKSSENHEILDFLRISFSRIFETDRKCNVLMELLCNCDTNHSAKEAGNYMFALLLYLSELSPDSVVKTAHDSETARLFKIEYLFNHYVSQKKSPLLDDMAYELNISRRQLSRIIKTKYGCSFTEKITELRLIRAIGLLKSGETVTKTASEVGYSSVRAFYTAFHAKYGITPGDYRKTCFLGNK